MVFALFFGLALLSLKRIVDKACRMLRNARDCKYSVCTSCVAFIKLIPALLGFTAHQFTSSIVLGLYCVPYLVQQRWAQMCVNITGFICVSCCFGHIVISNRAFSFIIMCSVMKPAYLNLFSYLYELTE